VWVAASSLVDDEYGQLVNAVASGMAGYVLLAIIAIVSGGMGFGDVKLARFIGVVAGRFGWETFVLALFSGFVAGGLASIVLLLTGRKGRKDAIPFAPMLCLGGIIGLFAGPGPVRAWFGV
jgi:leader peptidase (prepilin peptidase)/N-methyltransferase